jgi:hypothetical protein
MTDEDWQISSNNEIKQLLAREVNPNAKKLKAARSKYVNDKLVKHDIYKYVNDELYYTKTVEGDDVTRKDLIEHLKEEFKKGKPSGKEKFDSTRAVNDYPGGSWDEVIAQEKEANQLRKHLYEEADKEIPERFRTMKGTYSESLQVPVDLLKGATPNQVAATLFDWGVKGVVDFACDIEDDNENHGPSTEGKWFFPDPDLKPKTRTEIRKLGVEIRKLVGNSLEVHIVKPGTISTESKN